MENNGQVAIATTIAPAGDLPMQRKALASWLDAGFRVLAANRPGEISDLRPFFPGVEFSSAPRDAAGRFGKPYIYLDDLLAALDSTGAAVVGVVNADIHLAGAGVHDFFRRQAAGSFVFGPRVDVEALHSRERGAWFGGFDFFLFDRRVIPIYPPEEFCLGLPWWDYWIVLVPLACGVPVKRVVSPLAYHVVHPTRYGRSPWLTLGLTLSKYFVPKFPVSEATMARYNAIMFDHIYRNPAVEVIALPETN